MTLPPAQPPLPLSACGGKEEKKEEEKESPGVRCLCSGQVMRESFSSFPKEGKVGAGLGSREAVQPAGGRGAAVRRPHGSQVLQMCVQPSLFSLSVSFLLSLCPEEPRLEGGPGDQALHPGLKPCHTSVSWQRDVPLQVLHSVPSHHSWEPWGLSYRVGTDI